MARTTLRWPGHRIRNSGLSALALVVGGFALISPSNVHAATAIPASAEGDSAAVLTTKTTTIGTTALGPVISAPANAVQTSPGVTYANIPIVAATNPPPAIVASLGVGVDTAKAVVPPTGPQTTQCTTVLPDPIGVNNGPLTGGNGCSNIAAVSLLSGAGAIPVLPGVPAPAPGTALVSANGVFAQSTTQSCTAAPTGTTSIVSLNVGGFNVVGGTNPTGLFTPTPSGQIPPNTVVDVPGIARVILNEQKIDNSSPNGQGLTVNAIHIITNPALAPLVSADVIVAHTHSNALCTTAQTPIGPTPPGVVVNKTDDTGGNGTPGQTVTYTLALDTTTNAATCPLGVATVTTVIDTLPPGFTAVSETGALGPPPPVTVTTNSAGQQVLTFSNPAGFPANPTETIVATIGANVPAGFYSNRVDVFSSCGENAGSSPPIHVTVAGPTPAPTAAPGVPNTGAGATATREGGVPGAALAIVPALVLLSMVGFWVRRRNGDPTAI